MKAVRQWQLILFLLVGLVLAACTATTSPTTNESNNTTTEQATDESPALSPAPTEAKRLSEEEETATEAEKEDMTAEAEKEAAVGEESATEGIDTSKMAVEMGEAVIVYEKQGGLRGIGPGKYVWTFYPDGLVTSSDGREWQVAPEEIEQLVMDIADLGFFDLESMYMPEDTCCDRVTYILAVQHEGQANKVTTLDGADAPPELFEAIGLVDDFLIKISEA